MKSGTVVKMMAGFALGAAAATAMSAMNGRSKKKIKNFCVDASRKLADKTNELMG